MKTIKAAVVQAAPVLFDKQATAQKAVKLIEEVADNGAHLLVFPEAFIPVYPRGLSFGMTVGSRNDAGRELWKIYWDNSVEIPGKTIATIAKAAKKHKIFVAIGVTERNAQTNGTLYCTLVIIDDNGSIIGVHRKLKPTSAERTIWGEGDGTSLKVYSTSHGKIGGLICWENYMPLARMTLYNQGIEIYLAPTADQRDSWQSTLKHIACEGRCFVLGCNQFVTKDMYPANLPGIEELNAQPDILCRGGSVIVSPFGEVIAGPLYNQEGILYAELDASETTKAKLDFDVAGHYARPDVFELRVNAVEGN